MHGTSLRNFAVANLFLLSVATLDTQIARMATPRNIILVQWPRESVFGRRVVDWI
jgi:hypothetical protein